MNLFTRLIRHLPAPWPVFALTTKKRRAAIFAQPFPPEWVRVLELNNPLYAKLPEGLRSELQGHVQVFLAEKRFEGCAGLVLDDEIKVTIAAQACLLLLNRPTNYYPQLSTVLVYPSTFFVQHTTSLGTAHLEKRQPVAGLAWMHDYVILSWDHVTRGASNMSDGHNVVLHEFAHQLDAEDGNFNGAPLIEGRTNSLAWAQMLSREYGLFLKQISRGRQTTIDEYGAENPAEFFAVLTEIFFERPQHLKNNHPELYSELTKFYRLDPAGWGEP